MALVRDLRRDAELRENQANMLRTAASCIDESDRLILELKREITNLQRRLEEAEANVAAVRLATF